MDTQQKELLRQYAYLKAEEKRITMQLEKLRPLVKDVMVAADAEKIESEFGSFTIKAVSVWKYSPAVEQAEKNVEKLKEKEKAEGVASCEPRYDLVFTAAKTPKIV